MPFEDVNCNNDDNDDNVKVFGITSPNMILYTLQVSVEERRERIDSVLDEILSVPRCTFDHIL